MRIAGIQISAGKDLERNVQRAIEMAEVAIGKDARIICYPELFLTPWFPRREEASLQSWARWTFRAKPWGIRKLSENTKTVLVVPFFESAQDKYYNSTAIIDSGLLIGTYRKMHVPNLPATGNT